MLAADITKALSIEEGNGKGELNKTEVKQLLQPLEAKDSPVIKNSSRSDRHGRYTRLRNSFQLLQFTYAEIIHFITLTVNMN